MQLASAAACVCFSLAGRNKSLNGRDAVDAIDRVAKSSALRGLHRRNVLFSFHLPPCWAVTAPKKISPFSPMSNRNGRNCKICRLELPSSKARSRAVSSHLDVIPNKQKGATFAVDPHLPITLVCVLPVVFFFVFIRIDQQHSKFLFFYLSRDCPIYFLLSILPVFFLLRSFIVELREFLKRERQMAEENLKF